MKLISWNVNGFRACLQKGFAEFFTQVDADIFCLQETKMQEGQANFNPEGYFAYYNSAIKKGYSGTAVFSKQQPLQVTLGINDQYNDEGRVLTLEYPEFYLVNCYVPNSQTELARLEYRLQFEDTMRNYLSDLNKRKPVIYCGDLNVAHQEIDLKNPKTNTKSAGFTLEEREKFSQLLTAGFTDSYRYLYPETTGVYSWWSYRFKAREKNAGWRIDYFVVANSLAKQIIDAKIHMQVLGSDHCPVELEIKI
ncbi:exodeoxyribonuclease III [Succinispira mobilis]|uniref:exodeoxyribonuclease III n=1 Tax=Succinispira mobilis TaxID=78120 RepID=UPI00036956A1|nr:exodeoxyribonuclease III [Succinispira mobilis]